MRDKNDRRRPETIPEDDFRLFDDLEDEIEDDEDQVGTPSFPDVSGSAHLCNPRGRPAATIAVSTSAGNYRR